MSEKDNKPLPEDVPNSPWLTRREVAAILGKSTRTIARWDAEGRGPTRAPFGGNALYSRDSVMGMSPARKPEIVVMEHAEDRRVAL